MTRSAPAVHVLVDHFGRWVIGLCGLWLLAAASLIVWGVFMFNSSGASTTTMALLSLGLVSLGLPLTLLPFQATSLRWDGQSWHAGPADGVGDEPWDVDVTVCFDFGGWVLLRLHSETPGFPRRRAWLPVDMQSLALQSHGLRCALFAAGRSYSSNGTDRARLS